MGIGANEDHNHYHKKANNNNGGGGSKFSIKTLMIVIFTNLFTIYIFTGFNLDAATRLQSTTTHFFPIAAAAWNSSELRTTRRQLEESNSVIVALHHRLNSTNLLLQSLLIELTSRSTASEQQLPAVGATGNAAATARQLIANLFETGEEEVKLAIGAHKLPLGYSPRSGSDEIDSPVGAGCLNHPKELAQYMTYDVGGTCPSDDVFAQRLMLKGCEPLPRRRCHPRTPKNYVEPTSYPGSLWTTPPDASIVWDPYTCKGYKCLVDRKKVPGFYDCKDCFDLGGRERSRWMVDKGGLDFGIDEVLKTKHAGTIRIGMDIGGGSGTFAARMSERNITIITSTMNLDGPFNSFIASRGLIPIHFTVTQRLPFFENTLDIVHSMHILSNWIPDTMLEFTLYDVYRVLRPGGLFWLDHFFCLGNQLNETYIPMLDRVGFKKLRWHAGMKLDRGVDKNEWYFSALLEKPVT
ncbi:Probable methyltransferase At1g29790 [Linum grandiflorum]